MPDLKAVQGGTDLPGQSTSKPPVPVPGTQPQTAPTPAPPAATQIGTRPPTPAGWESDVSRVLNYYLALFAEQGQPALKRAEAWVTAERAK